MEQRTTERTSKRWPETEQTGRTHAGTSVSLYEKCVEPTAGKEKDLSVTRLWFHGGWRM